MRVDLLKLIPLLIALFTVFAAGVKGYYEVEQHRGALDDHGGKLVDLYHRDERVREQIAEIRREMERLHKR